MARAFANRIARLESIASPPPPVPHVLKVQHGETKAEALERFRAQFAGRRRHGLLVVPARVSPEHRDEWKRAFKARSIRLVEEARSQRIEEGNVNDHTRIFTRQHGGGRRVQSASNIADTAQHIAWRPRRLRE